MEERIKRIDTPEKCEVFAMNAIAKGREDLAILARKRALELKADMYGASTPVEKEVLEAIYAYEAVRSAINQRNTRATRTWNMVKDRGLLGAAEHSVTKKNDPQGYTDLVEMGLEDYTFEAVVLRYPDKFSEQAVTMAREKLDEWKHE